MLGSNFSEQEGVLHFSGTQPFKSIFEEFREQEERIIEARNLNRELQQIIMTNIDKVQEEKDTLNILKRAPELIKHEPSIVTMRKSPYLSIGRNKAPFNLGNIELSGIFFNLSPLWQDGMRAKLFVEVNRRKDMTLARLRKERNDEERKTISLTNHDWREVAGALQDVFTPEQCKEKWESSETKTERQKAKLSLVDLPSLKEAVAKYGIRDWKKVSEEMSPRMKISPIECFKAYQRNIAKSVSPWKSEEVESLKKWMQYYSEDADKYVLVSSRIPDRSAQQCWVKWNSLQRIHSGRWSEEEDFQLLEAMKLHDKKWSRVAECVLTRTGPQCRDRWVLSLDPSLDFSPWSMDDKIKLVERVFMHGVKSWSLIAEEFPGRNDKQVKVQYNTFIKSISGCSSSPNPAECALNFLRNNRVSISGSHWLVSDKIRLLELVCEHGLNWPEIYSHFLERTNIQVKRQYFSIIKSIPNCSSSSSPVLTALNFIKNDMKSHSLKRTCRKDDNFDENDELESGSVEKAELSEEKDKEDELSINPRRRSGRLSSKRIKYSEIIEE